EHVSDFFVPPSSWGDYLVDPKPIQVSQLEASDTFESTPSVCAEAAIQFTGGCANVDGPALRLSVAPGSYFFELNTLDETVSDRLLLATDVESTQYFGPLSPKAEYSLTVVRFSGDPLSDSQLDQ